MQYTLLPPSVLHAVHPVALLVLLATFVMTQPVSKLEAFFVSIYSELGCVKYPLGVLELKRRF